MISYDWSNDKAQWAAAKPMDDEERLVTQTAMTKAASADARVFVCERDERVSVVLPEARHQDYYLFLTLAFRSEPRQGITLVYICAGEDR